MRVRFLLFLLLSIAYQMANCQVIPRIAKLKYNGGGDWYANKTALPNLIKFSNQENGTNLDLEEDVVEVGSRELFLYPYLYMTGHGNVVFSDAEATNLRKYLIAGGFLHIDDNYGLDKFVRLEMKKVFPELEFVELPFDHPIYHQKFDFAKGLPKIHEHDGKPAQGFGLIYEGKLVVFYSYECDLGNGWEDQRVHNDPEEKKAGSSKNGCQHSGLLFYEFFLVTPGMKLRSESVKLLLIFCVLVSACKSQEEKDEQTARQYCATCHLFPEPALLPKSIWQKDVLPQMAFHMGIDFSLLNKFSQEDQEKISAALPNASMVTDEEWQAIKRYYQATAPDTIHTTIPQIADTLLQFSAEAIKTKFYPMNTFISFDSTTDELFMGSRYAKLYKLNNKLQIVDSTRLPSAPSQVKFISEEEVLLLGMGIMDPNDQPAGSLLRLNPTTKQFTTIIDSLKRPVYFEQVDLDKNGKDDFVICEYGNFSGALTAYKNKGDNQYERRELISLPGARKVIITDLDGNGFLDIVALMCQGDEKIVALYNHGNFIFRMATLLKFPPVYGSSYFDLVDLNGDKKLDILYTNGDNADFSMILKPYHGVRTFINQGDNDYKESWFYNVHGASQAVAKDFDQDGDLDIAVISFFPPFGGHDEQGFIYFENNGGRYIPQITKLASKGRWIFFSCADFDQDGDEDILVSALDFNNGTPAGILGKWKAERVSLLVLRNKLQ